MTKNVLLDDYKDVFLKISLSEAEAEGIKLHWRRFMDTLKIIDEGCQIGQKLRVLDIGLGSGWFSILARQLYDWDIAGIDIERSETLQWAKRFENFGISFQCCDVTKEKIPFENNTFDLVLFAEVLEHLIIEHPPFQILSEIRRVMKENATLILTTPNFAALHKRVLMMLGKNPYSYGYGGLDGKVESGDKHFREYTLEDLRYVLGRSNFKIEKVVFKNYYVLRRMRDPISFMIPSLRDSFLLRCKKLP